MNNRAYLPGGRVFPRRKCDMAVTGSHGAAARMEIQVDSVDDVGLAVKKAMDEYRKGQGSE